MHAMQACAPGFNDLRISEQPIPRPCAQEILVRVKAASLNYRDLVVLKGIYKPNIAFPFVPLSDACGEVVEVGSDVTRFKTGDRVVPTFIQGWPSGVPIAERRADWTLGWPRTGVLQDYIVVPADDAVAAPANLSDVEAATLPIAAVTAWSALMAGAIKAGDWVLVEGTGGVGLFALQFAKCMGAKVALITSTHEKVARVQALGADCVINYRSTPNWEHGVREATGGRGVDIVVETAGSTLPQALSSVAFGGFIGVVGFLGGFETRLGIVPLIEKMIRLQGIAVGPRDQFEAMIRAIEAHDIRPLVETVFPLEQAADAFALMDRGGHFGKIAVRL
jgi:NADPH:quinone reductase-like Zn-dependent oxidoreductase